MDCLFSLFASFVCVCVLERIHASRPTFVQTKRNYLFLFVWFVSFPCFYSLFAFVNGGGGCSCCYRFCYRLEHCILPKLSFFITMQPINPVYRCECHNYLLVVFREWERNGGERQKQKRVRSAYTNHKNSRKKRMLQSLQCTWSQW